MLKETPADMLRRQGMITKGYLKGQDFGKINKKYIFDFAMT